MFEYMNPFLIAIVSIFLFFCVLITLYEQGSKLVEGTKFKPPYFLYISTILLIVVLFIDAQNLKDTVSQNKNLFKNDKKLQCVGFGVSYIVSKDNGWEILDERHFTDGKIILNINNCEEMKTLHQSKR